MANKLSIVFRQLSSDYSNFQNCPVTIFGLFDLWRQQRLCGINITIYDNEDSAKHKNHIKELARLV